MTKYGPWKIWNGGDCPVEDGARGQVQFSHDTRDEFEGEWSSSFEGLDWSKTVPGQIIAYREVIVPVVRVDVGHVRMFGTTGLSVYGGAEQYGDTDCRDFKITITDDEPSIEWVE